MGERAARLLEWLEEVAGLDVTQVQATGHSLGSHVCGAIGQHLEKFRLPFITGQSTPYFDVTQTTIHGKQVANCSTIMAEL